MCSLWQKSGGFQMKIGVVGLGMAGLPLACVAADKGHSVVGIDLDEKRCRMINEGINPIKEEPELSEIIKKNAKKNLFATSNYNDAKDCNFYIVIVPLLVDENHNPDFSHLKKAFTDIGKILSKNDCVVLETTVPPGTTETKVKTWLEESSGLLLGDFYLAYSPERIMTGYSVSRLRDFPKIIGGVNKISGKKAYDVYKTFIGKLSLVSSARAAEFTKVIEGCYRNTNIALANELFKIADELNIDFYEARNYANHTFCNIHLPSTGVGGHCIPVYPWFLINEMEKKGKEEKTLLLKTSTSINDDMINYWSDKIIEKSKLLDKPLESVKICINGISFREGVKSLYYSRNLKLIKNLYEKGLNVYAFDPLVSRDEIEKLNLRFIQPDMADIVFDSFNLEIK
jgi:UDP-N-acetyl-D-mannosaminuronic acid dehydrogenase